MWRKHQTFVRRVGGVLPHCPVPCPVNIIRQSRRLVARESSTITRASPILKRPFLSAVTSDVGLAVLAPFRRRCASIFFLHRFAAPDFGVRGHDPAILRGHLEYLRARRYRLMSLSDLVEHVEQNKRLEQHAVVFTVDDGYADFADIASPVFAAYDCPVTVFLITDFVSGRLWNWWDKVDWVFRESKRDALNFEIAGENLGLHWKGVVERDLVSEVVIERLKQVPDAVKEERILALARALEVDLPERVPSRDRAMTWDQVRQCARKGATFGPHTVTHPILSRVDARRAHAEIAQSWRALTAETGAFVPVFCYPNGTAGDFSAREQRSVESAGMKAALSTIPGSVISTPSGMKVVNRFSIPRFSYVEDKPEFVRIVSGLER